jgi:hypothetical protein
LDADDDAGPVGQPRNVGAGFLAGVGESECFLIVELPPHLRDDLAWELEQ